MTDFASFLGDCPFYGIVDTGYVAPENMFSKCAALAESGTRIIQLRAKNETHEQRRKMALELLPIFRKPNAPVFIINDDVELAAEICKEIDNAGLHVGQDDLSPALARREIGARAVLGLSTHSPEQAAAANELVGVLDYFAVGPVYATMTKPGRAAVGLELVKFAAQKLRKNMPWFCIGGINAKTAAAVRAAGGERIVAVSDVLLPADTKAAVYALLAAFSGKTA